MRYFSNIITIIHYNFGSDWDSAELLDYNINNKGATNFFYQDASLNVVKREQYQMIKQCVTLIKIKLAILLIEN